MHDSMILSCVNFLLCILVCVLYTFFVFCILFLIMLKYYWLACLYISNNLGVIIIVGCLISGRCYRWMPAYITWVLYMYVMDAYNNNNNCAIIIMSQ